MTCYEFNALPEEYQLAAVADTGRLLSMSWERELAVSLYHLPDDLLIELAYDTQAYRIRRFQAFINLKNLAGYLSSRARPKGPNDATSG